MPGIAWENDAEHPPAIHPDDLAVAKQMSAQLATAGRVGRALRLLGTSGEWVSVQVEASLMLLDQHTTAALVTLSAVAPS
jgi:hypothetical protein